MVATTIPMIIGERKKERTKNASQLLPFSAATLAINIPSHRATPKAPIGTRYKPTHHVVVGKPPLSGKTIISPMNRATNPPKRKNLEARRRVFVEMFDLPKVKATTTRTIRASTRELKKSMGRVWSIVANGSRHSLAPLI